MRAAHLLATLVLAGGLSGCLGGSPSAGSATATEDGAQAGKVRSVLEGFILTTDALPVAQAVVALEPGDTTRATDDRGAFRFINLDPGAYTLTVDKEGFRTASQKAAVREGFATIVNITLEEAADVAPHHETASFVGQVACHASFGDDPDTSTSYDCGAVDPVSVSRKEFRIEPGAMAVVVDVDWTPTTAAARNLTIKVETVDLGSLNVVFAHQPGPPGMQVVLSEGNLRKYFPTGGNLRVSMTSGPSVRVDPVPMGAGLALQQPFDVHVTTFFGEAPSEGWSYLA